MAVPAFAKSRESVHQWGLVCVRRFVEEYEAGFLLQMDFSEVRYRQGPCETVQ